MTLPSSQQHALDAIDDNLQTAEPRLATMFGVFTDLTRQEAMPAVETLPPESWWTWHPRPGRRAGRRRPASGRSGPGRRMGRIVLVPLLLIAALSVVVVSLAGSGAAGRRGRAQAARCGRRQCGRSPRQAAVRRGKSGPCSAGPPACARSVRRNSGRGRRVESAGR